MFVEADMFFRKYVSKFVKKMREIDAIPKKRMIWDSQQNGTYIRKKHGALK